MSHPPNYVKVLNGVPFNARYWQIVCAIGDCASNKEIAARLKISQGTVKQYLDKIYRRMEEVHPELRSSHRRLRIVLALWVNQHRAVDQDRSDKS